MILLNEPNIEHPILVVSLATFTLTLRKSEGNISKKTSVRPQPAIAPAEFTAGYRVLLSGRQAA